MADVHRKRFPWLAVIVLALLTVMGLIALVEGDGATRSGDLRESMPVDRGETAPVMPEPAPDAPVPQR